MDKLPVEALQNIFLSTLPSIAEMRDKSVKPSPGIVLPLRISHVCRHWREVSIAFGTLWSFLSISRYTFAHRNEDLLSLYDTWLQRTNGSPLNFKIALVGSGDGVPEYIVGSLVSHQRRWRDVDFEWSFDASPELTGIELTQMPMLESIQLEAYISSDEVETILPRISFANSIRLQRFDLRGDIKHENGEKLIHTLRRARFECRCSCVEGIKQFMDILEVGPNLEELYFTFHRAWEVSTQQSLPAPTFLVHNLRKLTLLEHPSFLFTRLKLPSLTHLTYLVASPKVGLSALSDFVLRSNPPLQSLSLALHHVAGFHYDGPSQDILIAVLRRLSALQELEISLGRDMSWLFQELNFDSHRTCPELRSFRLSSWSVRYFEDRREIVDAIRSMLHSRRDIWKCARINSIPVQLSDSDKAYDQLVNSFSDMNGMNDLYVGV